MAREPIDHGRAVREHDAYEDVLRGLGCTIQRLPDLPENPDSVFVEDTAVVVDTIAVIARPGAPSRRGEVQSTADALARYRPLAFIEPPGTLDGGDVMVTPGAVFVGVSGRTNAGGARQLAAILAPHGFQVVPVAVTGCLHLKSAVTHLRAARFGGQASDSLLINPQWVDVSHFAAFDLIEVDPGEPEAANVLLVGDRVICAEAYPKTRQRLETARIATVTVPAGELAKAEGGLTCGAIIVPVFD